jgi:hypothetical protein
MCRAIIMWRSIQETEEGQTLFLVNIGRIFTFTKMPM